MAEDKDIFNQATKDLGDSPEVRLVNLEERLQALENRIGRTTRELGPQGSNISKELEGLHKELDQLKVGVRIDNLTDDLKRQCVYCGKGAYRKVANGKNLTPHDAIMKIGEWGVPWVPNVSFKEWIIQQCNHCGNIQYFAVPGAANPDAWG